MNNKAGAAAAAAILNPAVRAQVRQLAERDGVPSEGISAMLGIPLLLVQEILAKASVPATTPTDTEAALDERIASIEERLVDAEISAIAVLEDVCANAQSDGVRLAAATRILEIRAGKLRPPKKTEGAITLTIETMNTMILQAQKAYTEQRAVVATPPSNNEVQVSAPQTPSLERN